MQIQLPIKDSSFEGENWLPPLSFPSFFTSSFLSPMGKIRLLFEPFIPRGKEDANETVSSFIKRRLGQEASGLCCQSIYFWCIRIQTRNSSSWKCLSVLGGTRKNIVLFFRYVQKKNTRKRLPKTRLISTSRDAPTN